MFFNFAVLLAGAGFAVASSGISSQCQSALLNVSASSSAACSNPSGLISLAITNSSSSSIIPGVNTWLSGLCSQTACTNSTLQTVITEVISGCSTELSSLGITTSNPTAIVTSIQAAYPTVRQLVCLKDTAMSTLCVPELLTNIQSATTTLSLNNIVALVTKLVSGQSTGITSSAVCNNCSKAAYTVLSQGLPAIASTAQSAVSSECGANYTDGQMPSGIQESATNSSSTTSSSGAIALSFGSLNMGVAAVAAVSAAFAILA
ncbi:hypothetical protein DEU56DRAFT_543433 [Suillus clintonianus]|uniref:uncharacterized protein n=1 Tax=Suillus clintonianus TaxID=1904413 RepID=UPI001B8659E8|nr:uncharacterized protein DEU56DRAFT_543433 [Suillus clintonianus]KAG2126301.1 hypothetical protein DEU56DRAFT_543433 [Suillus clintonianus]